MIETKTHNMDFLSTEQRAKIEELKANGATWIINHSGGKDSQAMYLFLTGDLQIPTDQILVIHAILTGVDWEGSEEHIEKTLDHGKLNGQAPAINYVEANKSFFEMVRRRKETRPDAPSFPSASTRQCTSDLKRDPIMKAVRHHSKATGQKLYINCIGIRAQESTSRAKKDPFKLNKRESKAGREIYELYPIFEWSTKQVFDKIKEYDQKPFWTYGKGMQRKSCVFCIMACGSDLKTAAELAPKKYQEYVALEEEVGYTMMAGGKSLVEIIGKTPEQIMRDQQAAAAKAEAQEIQEEAEEAQEIQEIPEIQEEVEEIQERMPKAEYFKIRLAQAQAQGRTRKAEYYRSRLAALQEVGPWRASGPPG